MSDFQELKKQDAKKNVSSQGGQAKEKAAESSASLCTNCGAAVPDGALFCPECGFNINAPVFCPNCGAATVPGADICEACKAWLLDGQCTFCYAPLAPDAAFCADCGNPKEGVQCPGCGTLSIFDFCTTCGKPLTEGAVLALEMAKNDPDAKALVDAVQETVGIEAELARLEALINSGPVDSGPDPAPPPVKKQLFSASQISAIMKTGDAREVHAQQKAEEAKKTEVFAKKAEEEKRRAKLAEAREKKEALEREKAKAIAAAEAAQLKFKSKTFLTHQDARRFHNSMKPPGVKGWLCNYMNIVHFDGPNGCDQPGLGGYWYSGDTVEVMMSGPS